MKQLIVVLFALNFAVSGCHNEVKKQAVSKREAKGNVSFGGVFRVNMNENFSTLYPHHVDEIIAQQISSQVYEGLVKLSPKNLSVLPSIAYKWEIANNAQLFTFHLRKGVYFHDDACFEKGIGREVTAADFKFCFEKLCSHNEEINSGFYIFQDKVKGANEYYASTEIGKPLTEGVTGIQVLNDSTLSIELLYPFAGFINLLTMPFAWVFPQEAVLKYGSELRSNCVGTGPFYLKDSKHDESLILARNENYWGTDSLGNQLPYLDIIKFTFNKEKTSEYLEFKKGNLDFVFGLPSEMRTEIIEESKQSDCTFNLFVTPILSISYYGFQTQGNLFKNKKLRQAFNYAIDREKLVKFVLQDEATPANYGIVPPSFPNYSSSSIKGYKFDPQKARTLLAEAGYPNGKGFPVDISLLLNSGGERNIEVAEAIQKMLADNLSISIKLNVLPFPQKLNLENNGQAQFWKSGWVADYPDPQTFLDIFYGKLVPDVTSPSPVNSGRYKSALFDSLYEAALKESDMQKRFKLFEKADQVAIDDAAYMPVYYDNASYLTKKNVANLQFNSFEYLDFSTVYFTKKDTTIIVTKSVGNIHGKAAQD